MNATRKYQMYSLKNGLLVALEKTPTRTIAGQLSVYHGTVDEKPGEEGIAHFLEHSLVAGGARNYSPVEMERRIGLFGEFNATTDIEETVLYGGFTYGQLENFLDVTSAIAFSPRLDETKIEEERARILREISDYFGNPEYRDFKRLRKEVLGETHPLTLETLGEGETVEKITREQLKAFHSRGFYPNNMELVLVGDLPRNVKPLIERYFGDAKKGRARGVYRFPYIDHLDRRVIRHVAAPELLVPGSNGSNASVYLEMFVPPKIHEDMPKLCLIANILGGGMDSYLHKEVSQRRGLAYSIWANYNGQSNLGEITAHGKIDARRIEEAMDAIFGCLKQLRENPADENLLERKKSIAEYTIAKALETNMGRASAIRGEIDNGMKIEKVLQSISAVTVKGLQEAAQKYLPKSRDDNYTLLIRDPLKS